MRKRFDRQLLRLNQEMIDIERIGDQADNIAEWVEFSITGEYKGGSL